MPWQTRQLLVSTLTPPPLSPSPPPSRDTHTPSLGDNCHMSLTIGSNLRETTMMQTLLMSTSMTPLYSNSPVLLNLQIRTFHRIFQTGPLATEV